MIPKIIHYCWLGKGEKSEQIKKCIKSWKTFYPDFEIIEWNEDNFNIYQNNYAAEAYREKKYAFVADYIRLKVLYELGGIYLDTDVEILKRNVELERCDFVVGFEATNRIGTAIIMANKNNSIIEKWLASYSCRHFINERGKPDFTPNVQKLTEIMDDFGFEINGKRQKIGNYMVYEQRMLYPYAIGDANVDLSESIMVHWCNGSWVSGNVKIKHRIVTFIKKGIGSKNYTRLKIVKDKFVKQLKRG